MRDEHRISRVLELMGEIWDMVPDWRFGQIIYNATGFRGDIFYLDDETLENGLINLENQLITEEKEK
jgi:uncharacterized protein YihD (DUF1040 family)